MASDGYNSIIVLKGVTLADIMFRIRRSGGEFQFTCSLHHPGITYRDPAGNYIAVYEERGWQGEVWCGMYRACDPAKGYADMPETERKRLIALTRPRSLDHNGNRFVTDDDRDY